MTHLEQTIKDLHQNFSGFDVFSNYDTTMARHRILVTNDYLKELEDLIIQSHIKYLQSEIERLEECKRDLSKYESYVAVEINAHNKAIDDQITHYKQEIINAEKLLNNHTN